MCPQETDAPSQAIAVNPSTFNTYVNQYFSATLPSQLWVKQSTTIRNSMVAEQIYANPAYTELCRFTLGAALNECLFQFDMKS